MSNEALFRGADNIMNSTSETKNFVFPVQLHDLHFRFLKVRRGGKEAVELDWQKFKNYSWHDPEIQQWYSHGGNYGVTCPSGFCVFIDADTEKIQDTLETKLPPTFRYSTGKEGHFQFVYFIEDSPIGCIPLQDGAYIKGRGGYALGPGSVHPNGTVYGSNEIRNVPIAVIPKTDLLDALEPFLLKKERAASHPPPRYERISRVTHEQIEKTATDLLPAWVRADHRRHNLTLAIIGSCERSGWARKDINDLLVKLAEYSGKGREHVSQVDYVYGRDGKKYGFPTLTAILEALL
jgi:hypothetical protein